MSNGTARPERRHLLHLTAGLLLTLLGSAAQAASPLTREFAAVYELSGIMSFGETTYRLNRRPNKLWRIEAETVAIGSLAWLNSGHILHSSDWRLQDDQAVPVSYLDENTFGARDKLKEYDFQWSAGKAIMSKKGKTYEIALQGGELDPLLYQLVLRRDLARDLAGGRQDYHYRIVDGKRVNDYHFKVVGRETVQVPWGKFDTVALVRIGDKRRTRFWCSPELDYLPVKIIQTDGDDDEYEAVLKSLTGITANRQN